MVLPVLQTGVSGVTLTFTTIDNMVSVDINADGPQGNGTLGWSRVFEINVSGMGYYGGKYEVLLDPFLSNYHGRGAYSVTLSIVASNWTSAGQVIGTLYYGDGQTQPIEFDSNEWSSTQIAYTLQF
jgi:hypothetical protein